MLSRRRILGLLGSSCAVLLAPRWANAGVARAVSLTDLVKRSTRVVHGLALEGSARWETIGDQRRIVSYVRFRVDELIGGAPPSASEIYVRTLGGQVNGVGQIVHGEAVLFAGQRCLAFLSDSGEGFDYVTAMAQGHYPLASDAAGALRLKGSPGLPELTGHGDSAVRRLVGQSLDDARTLIRGIAP
ncbi:MAG TPA: hypothetical protein VGM29_10425 [Polyangiaceae bacterium]